MKRLGSVFLSLALLVGLATVLDAQGTVEAEDGDTSIELDGETSTTLFRRDNSMNSILNGSSTDAQSAMLYQFNLGLTAEVGERVTGRLELENEVLDGARGGASANNAALIGESTSFESVQLSEAYIKADRFLAEGLSLKIGIQDYETDLRGDGNPFFLDLQGSEGVAPGSSGRDLNNDAGGIKLTADIGQNSALDLFWFTVRENSTPNVGQDNDEHILGAVYNGSIQETASYHVLGTWFQDVSGTTGSSAHGIWTVGGGVEYDVTSNSNAYGELYVQGGERSSTADQDTTFAADLGYEGEAGPIGYDASITHVSGDDPNTQDNEGFVSYEDNDDTMILEENILGLDVDQNYQKLQAIGEYTTTFRRKDDLSVELLAAYAQLAEDSGVNEDKLGIETDLVVTWAHSESLDFEVGLARVWSGDFWDSNFAGSSDALDLYTVTANLNF